MTWLEQTLGTVLVLILGGGGGALILKMFQAWHAARLESRRAEHVDQQEDRADVWTRQALLIDRQDKQLAAVQAEQQRSLVAEMACRQEVARLRALGQWLYDLVRGLHAALGRAGVDAGPLPEFPDFAQMAATTAAEREFVQRTTEHTTALVRDEAARLKGEDGGPARGK
jgi:hypothetical protein